MPSSLAAAAPSTVLPKSLSTSFTESRSYPMLSVQYHDGTSERGLVTDGVNSARSLRMWRQSKRLSPTDLATLKTFILAQQGKPFYYYDPFDVAGGAIGSNWDGTGSSVLGRHICIITIQEWSQTTSISNSDGPQLELKEVL